MNNQLQIGKNEKKEISLSLQTMQRHFACFGSAGSGKTVACKVLVEEFARNGIPVIAIDPQGDIASLICPEEKEIVENSGTPINILEDYKKNTEVVIWTPGSSKGIPLSVNPLQFKDIDLIESLPEEEKRRYCGTVAHTIICLLGYKPSHDESQAVKKVLEVLFNYCIEKKIIISNFTQLIEYIDELPESVLEKVQFIINDDTIKKLKKKLSLLTIGTDQLIFEHGVPANIDTLFGLNEPGKTRISVIYLNTLDSQDEKDDFISCIAQLLYQWMLKNPLPSGDKNKVQCAFYIDEASPFIPPVRKPSCKPILKLLFKQARKYGVSCILATQNTGDIDYKAISQFTTTNLGSLYVKQDINKIKDRLISLSQKNKTECLSTNQIEKTINALPSLEKGNFLLICPEEFNQVENYKVRWLVTKHHVISEDMLSSLIPKGQRDKFRKMSEGEINSNNKFAKDVKAEEIINLSNSSKEKHQQNGEETSKPEPEKIKAVIENENSEKNETAEFFKVVKHKIFEKDLKASIRRELSGTFFKSEEVIDTKFIYFPLIKVELFFTKKSGVFKKSTEEISENLYLDYQTHKILHFNKGHFEFEKVPAMEPDKISDLDYKCDVQSTCKNEIINFEFEQIKSGIDQMEIKFELETKYPVDVINSELILLPIWSCKIKEKVTDKTRNVFLDGIYGKSITIESLEKQES